VNLLQKIQRKRAKNLQSVISSADEDELKIEKGGEIRFCESIDNKTSAKNNIFYHLATLVNRVESEHVHGSTNLLSVLPTGRNFCRKTQKWPQKTLCTLEYLQPIFRQILPKTGRITAKLY
jgi:hypothetical protein